MWMRLPPCLLACLLVLPAHAAPSRAAVEVASAQPSEAAPEPGDPAATREREWHYLLGAEMRSSPATLGPGRRDRSWRPVAAVAWGPWQLSTGGGRSLMKQGLDRESETGAGLEGLLHFTQRFRVGLSLNLDRGRRARDVEGVGHVPKTPTTLRLRLRARYKLTDRWTASAALSQDLLGKGTGLRGDLALAYGLPLSQRTSFSAVLFASVGNKSFMRTQYGVPADLGSGPGYAPGGGWHRTGLSFDVAHSLSRHWVVFGGVGYARPRGPAQRSSLVRRRGGVSGSLGLAWRN